ncbi:HAD family hydrolase [Kribbella sp. NBC_00709]|uniref:HAD family hydrolase n=1 Tax=Kribbella sp. NBC_00709 TaxID=2975972 RepID=UPI002E2A3B48|nr:HAD family hydrolase [Kribbella sp. NBC_00709]
MKAIIFDLDNTLFDHTGCAVRGLRSWLTELGITPTDELIAEWFVIEEDQFNRFLSGELTHQGQRRGRLRTFLPVLGRPVPSTDAELDEVFTGYLQQYQANWIAYPDARPALEVARGNGWRIGVLTNGSTKQQNAKLAAIGLADLIDVVCTSESLGVSKPAPEAYLRTCEALGVEPADVLMIGDNLELDVLGAQAAGLAARHLDRAIGMTLTQVVSGRQ